MLSARVETGDRVARLDAGADDYLGKPYEPDEVLARIRALLRRSAPKTADQPERFLEVGPVRLDPDARRVWCDGREVALSKTEFDLLDLLLANEGIVLEHHVIYDRIWGYDFGPDSKNLAVYIGYLRRSWGCPGTSSSARSAGSAQPCARGELNEPARSAGDLLRGDCLSCRCTDGGRQLCRHCRTADPRSGRCTRADRRTLRGGAARRPPRRRRSTPGRPGRPGQYPVQGLRPDGAVVPITLPGVQLPVDDEDVALAASGTVQQRYRTDDPDARALPGSGLWLAIVSEVARTHGGETFARNRGTADGTGAEVGMRLPLAPNGGAGRPPSPTGLRP